MARSIALCKRSITIALAAALAAVIGYGLGARAQGAAVSRPALARTRLAALTQPMRAAPGDPLFMQVPGIPGESADAGHPGWIDLDAWTWSATAPGGRALFRPVSVTFTDNRALPPLLRALATGARLLSVTLQAAGTTADGKELSYLTITLSGVTVTRAQEQASQGRPGEKLSLSFTRISYKYLAADGQATSFCWDVATQTAC